MPIRSPSRSLSVAAIEIRGFLADENAIIVSKLDLKSARQVSKVWSTSASEVLFEKFYVSANQEDLDVFLAIAKHEELRGCVRKLVYDVACVFLFFTAPISVAYSSTGFKPRLRRTEYLSDLKEGWEPWVSVSSIAVAVFEGFRCQEWC